MNLLDAVKAAPAYEARVPSRNRWVKYKAPYFVLVTEKGFPKKKAIEFIAELEKLSEKDTAQLYNASKFWKNGGAE